MFFAHGHDDYDLTYLLHMIYQISHLKCEMTMNQKQTIKNFILSIWRNNNGIRSTRH